MFNRFFFTLSLCLFVLTVNFAQKISELKITEDLIELDNVKLVFQEQSTCLEEGANIIATKVLQSGKYIYQLIEFFVSSGAESYSRTCISKYTLKGKKQWENIYGGQKVNMLLDVMAVGDEVYLLYEKGTGLYPETMVLTKLNKKGHEEWEYNLENKRGKNSSLLALGKDGNILVASKNKISYIPYLSKISTEGKLIKEVSLFTELEEAEVLAIDLTLDGDIIYFCSEYMGMDNMKNQYNLSFAKLDGNSLKVLEIQRYKEKPLKNPNARRLSSFRSFLDSGKQDFAKDLIALGDDRFVFSAIYNHSGREAGQSKFGLIDANLKYSGSLLYRNIGIWSNGLYLNEENAPVSIGQTKYKDKYFLEVMILKTDSEKIIQCSKIYLIPNDLDKKMSNGCLTEKGDVIFVGNTGVIEMYSLN